MEKPIFAALSVLLAALMIFGAGGQIVHAGEDPYREAFDAAAEEYQLDADLLRAIATLESGYGASAIARNRNNWFGWMRHNGQPMDFDTVEDGIRHVARAISNRPHGTLEEIASWYNAPNAAFWAGKVKEIWEELKHESN